MSIVERLFHFVHLRGHLNIKPMVLFRSLHCTIYEYKPFPNWWLVKIKLLYKLVQAAILTNLTKLTSLLSLIYVDSQHTVSKKKTVTQKNKFVSANLK